MYKIIEIGRENYYVKVIKWISITLINKEFIE
jgi:hypothetical protein